jgi:hypothetical protein
MRKDWLTGSLTDLTLLCLTYLRLRKRDEMNEQGEVSEFAFPVSLFL